MERRLINKGSHHPAKRLIHIANMTMKKYILATFCFIATAPVAWTQQVDLKQQAEASLKKGVAFFHSTNSHGGYVYHVTPDLSLRWGEGSKDAETIEVQPPGTPAVGQSFLRAYQVTGDKKALDAAKEAAYALVRG